MKKLITLTILFFLTTTTISSAHPGRTDSKGCHKDKKTQTRHCHNKEKADK